MLFRASKLLSGTPAIDAQTQFDTDERACFPRRDLKRMQREGTAKLEVNVGRMTSVAHLQSRLSGKLQQFNRYYQTGTIPDVEWDLRELAGGRMNLAALTAFVSIADRLRAFTSRTPVARVSYNPGVFSFLSDIGFLRTCEQRDLFHWSTPDAIAGFLQGRTNPATKIFGIRRPETIPSRDDFEAWKTWKDGSREELRRYMYMVCRPLFDLPSRAKSLPSELINVISNTTAELAINSMMWGHIDPFIGVQRSGAGITVAVCDSGIGLASSLRAKKGGRRTEPRNDAEAIVVASTLNEQDFGLFRAITLVVERGGKVMLATGNGEIEWRRGNWAKASKTMRDTSANTRVPQLEEIFGEVLRGKLDEETFETGFCRVWDTGLRGVRASFEIPLNSDSFK